MMNMMYLEKLTKEQINELPLRSYEGPIHLIERAELVDEAVKKLRGEEVLGFDIESKPCFTRGDSNPPALIQVACSDCVYIFRVVDMGLPESLCVVLADEAILKVGVSLRDDVKELRTLCDFTPAGFFDLGKVSKCADMKHHGLKGLAAVLLGFRISKSMQRSNWANSPLSEKQIRYAATDAWISRELYLEMKRRGLVDEYLRKKQEEQDAQPELAL
jgi:ribonuclease D